MQNKFWNCLKMKKIFKIFKRKTHIKTRENNKMSENGRKENKMSKN